MFVTHAMKYFVILLSLSVISCVLAQEPVAPARIDAATYQRVVEENLDLRKEQARIETETGLLRRKNATLLLDIQDLERKRDQLTALVAQLKTPDELASQMARLHAEKVVLVREIEHLRESITANATPTTNQPTAVAAPARESDLFRKLERENADLRGELAKARAMGMNESVAKEITEKSEMALKGEVSQLAAQYKEVSTALGAIRRREAALTKAMEKQAKKTFDAEKALRKAHEAQAQKDEEAEAAKEKAQKAEVALERLKAKTSASASSATQQVDSAATVLVLLADGQKKLLSGRVTDAEKLYLLAFKQEPKNAVISYNLGVLYGDYLKDYAKALIYYRNYLELAPTAADASIVRSWLIDMKAKAKW